MKKFFLLYTLLLAAMLGFLGVKSTLPVSRAGSASRRLKRVPIGAVSGERPGVPPAVLPGAITIMAHPIMVVRR